ncbi:tetraacyldisaccharide 4'-kinase [Caldimonas brevitalea]|uniref:Tetraacyldisaccharide 4'-kinase n=1 Tax=Caldimonas brevitalea TaxID=413882 RepID=A0A0G3BGR3_9BURK|nr:tetraacyldisaccharide 4'-kinase [Caldimonas brevitalea]AKJ28639.1 tetraacyldisaccharide 4'-kinase [Caldimonas brevitalea]
MSKTAAPSWQARVEAAWLRRGPLAWALLPLSGLYATLALSRAWLFRLGLLRRERLPVPVIVVGNVIAGGAGKTPTTMAIVAHLLARGRRPAIVSRGYGRQSDHLALVTPASDAREVGDEPLLMALRTGVPVAVGADRVAAGRTVLAAHPEVDVIVCDDGLQHLRLCRDIEVLVFDERGAGNGWWLPAGPLRDSARRRADLVLYNASAPSTPRPGWLAQRALRGALPLAAWGSGGGTPRPLEAFAGRPVLAVAGVAHPERFFRMLEAAGLRLERRPLPDHHDYQQGLPWDGWDGDVVLVTEKDAVKLRSAGDPRIWVVALDFMPDPGFYAALDSVLSRRLHD